MPYVREGKVQAEQSSWNVSGSMTVLLWARVGVEEREIITVPLLYEPSGFWSIGYAGSGEFVYSISCERRAA